jgi:hypothetical protein
MWDSNTRASPFISIRRRPVKATTYKLTYMAKKLGDRVAIAPFPPRCRSGLSPEREGGGLMGRRIMAGLAMDLLLFACTFTFVTGIIVAAAKFLL